MDAAQAIVKSLEKEGVTIVFGYPGATIAPLYDRLSKSKIKHVLVRHEQHAGHAASGYARISGRPGVCMATSGPGATNLLTALGTAYMDSIPLVAITGQVDSTLLGRDVFQEADITGAAEPFTKYSWLVKDAKELPRIIKEAFHIASTGRPGPVLIDIPVDIQLEKNIEFEFPKEADIRSYKPTLKGHTGQIKRVVRAIKNADHPLICVGGGIFSTQAQDMFKTFIEKTNIPVVSTLMGIGAIPTDHPLYMGQVGMHGIDAANEAISEADLLILLGARVSDRAVLLPDKVKRKTGIVHIDIDPAEIGKNLDTMLPVVGDVSTVMKQILEYKPARKSDEWTNYLSEHKEGLTKGYEKSGKHVNPKAFVNALSKAFPDDLIYCADVGQNQLWSAGNIDIRNGGRFLTTGGMGTMGYSIAASVGAKMASKERPVLAVCGDGSFQMSMMELATIVQNNLDIKIVVMVNGRLGLVREIQKDKFKSNYTAIDLSGSPDPTIIAKAYGIESAWAKTEEEASQAIEKLLKAKDSFLLAIEIDPEESTL